jgi:hypothetical protein
MKRKRPSFNETYYGFRTFSHLLEDAQRRGIVVLRRDQRSGSYIVEDLGTAASIATAARAESAAAAPAATAATTGVAVAAAPVAVGAEEAAANGGRPRRRRGRGRGRGRGTGSTPGAYPETAGAHSDYDDHDEGDDDGSEGDDAGGDMADRDRDHGGSAEGAPRESSDAEHPASNDETSGTAEKPAFSLLSWIRGGPDKPGSGEGNA